MSTGIVHQPDTPGSSGSPASLESSSNKHELVDLHGGGSGTCSPVIIEEECRSDVSGSPSRSPATPNLSFTPPTNGILTPPNDGDGGGLPEPVKGDRGAGRLKFYKDGVLCLELSHRDEGEKRKWVQIRTKTVFPTVVHTKKEVVIPRQISPPSLQSPLSVIQGSHHRLESSASQTSEDGSSMLSSPRVRESCWRKSVPHKGVSVNLEFFLRPAACVYLCRQSVPLKLCRKPFYFQQSAESIARLRTHLKCVCSNDAGNNNVGDTLNAEKSLTEEGAENAMMPSSDQRRLPLAGKLRKRNNSGVLKSTRPLLSIIVDKLMSVVNERNLCFLKSKPTAHADKIGTDFVVLPKKRTFKETDIKDFSSGTIRPAKISPKQKTVKTILNIPGFKSEPVKRAPEVNGNELSPQGSAVSRKQEKHESTKKFRSSPQSSSDAFSPSSNKSDSSRGSLCLSSLTPDQQQYFTKQTMSKAISYTINSLLSPQKPVDTSKKAYARSGLGENSSNLSREMKASTGHQQQGPGRDSRSNSFGKSDLDQNSFLRHLLDTSDPIPKTPADPKPEPTEIRQKQQSQRNFSGQNHSQSKSKDKESRTKSPMTDKSTKERHMQELGGNLAAPPGFPNMPVNLFPPSPFLPPSFFGPGGFPLQMQAYESLFGGRNMNNALAAAAAELQYQQSLIPPNMLQMQFNPAMAAAMAATYMGASSNPPQSFPDRGAGTAAPSNTGSRPSSLNHRSESKHCHSNVSKRDASPLPNGYIGSSGSIPVPFHIPTSDGRIRSGSFSGASLISNRSPRMTLPSTSDHNDDMPLNLSKKT